ncbi:MAG: dockerin type I repeat-containing protein, partial [Clostridia bacterium]|nr:dockerin type I repeat-containing protein [Clostridia bacterium]
ADGWLTGAPEGTTVQTLLSGLDWGKYCAVFRADGQPVAADAAVGTGMVLKLQQNGQTKQSVTIVVMGDTSGDGAVNETDLAQVRNHLLQAQQLTGAFAKAADCSGDGIVSVTDIIRLQALLLR